MLHEREPTARSVDPAASGGVVLPCRQGYPDGIETYPWNLIRLTPA